MRNIDFSSWEAAMTTIVGLAVFTLLGVGIRMLMMQTIEQRRERMNRQINERVKTLMAAYRTLGGSFTGQLTVDPTHLREVRERALSSGEGQPDPRPPVRACPPHPRRGRSRPGGHPAARYRRTLPAGRAGGQRPGGGPSDPYGRTGHQPAQLYP